MVKKLFKHEAIYYARTLLIFEIILFSLAISTRFIMFFEFDHWVYRFIQGSSFVLFGLAAIACIYASLAMTVVRFYRNLFSQEGYLTFALPVSTNQHILVKLVSALVYQGITVFSIIVASLITISGDFLNELLKAFWYLFNKVLEEISFKDGVNIVIYFVYFAVIILLTSIHSLLVYYACITIGQTAKKNRILAAVGCYFGYSFAVEIISTFFSIIINIFITTVDMDKFYQFFENNTHLCLHIIFIALIVWTLIFNIAFYIVIYKIISKKLNLE